MTQPSGAGAVAVDPHGQGIITRPVIALGTRRPVLARLMALQPNAALLKSQGEIGTQNSMYLSRWKRWLSGAEVAVLRLLQSNDGSASNSASLMARAARHGLSQGETCRHSRFLDRCEVFWRQ
jgi:hypothetical protein